MKIMFESDDNLPLNNTLKLHNLTTVVGSIFQEDNKYEKMNVCMSYKKCCNVKEGIDINKSNKSNKCMSCH